MQGLVQERTSCTTFCIEVIFDRAGLFHRDPGIVRFLRVFFWATALRI